MSYIAPDWDGVDFDPTDAPYGVIGALAVNFDLAAGWEPPPPPIEYRKPPLVSTTRYLQLAVSNPYNLRTVKPHEQGTSRNIAEQHHNNADAAPVNANGVQSAFDAVPPKDTPADFHPWGTSTPMTLDPATTSWHQIRPHDIAGDHPWSTKPTKDGYTEHPDNLPPPHDVSTTHRASDTIVNWQAPPEQKVQGYTPPDTHEVHFDLVKPYTPPGALVADVNLRPEQLIDDLVIPTRSIDSRHHISQWARLARPDVETIHPWDTGPRLGTEVDFGHGAEPNAPDNPENKRTYIVVNSSSLIAVATGQPLEFQDLAIQLDVDSYTWSMSCAILNRASMDQIRPTATGPAEVLATINGHQWRFIVESYSVDNRFTRERYQIQGVSRSQLLTAPYAPRRTGQITSPTNMLQVIAQQLEFTGFSVSLQTGLADYVIPAGAWGYAEKTALQVVAELVAALGAVIVPDPTTDELHIRHRYKMTPPWMYHSLLENEIDAIIQDSMVVSYASRWEPQPAYDAVFVSGITHGVAVDVVRTGTAGDHPAPDVYDALNVDDQQCRQRGMATIAASGPQEIVTIETVLPTSGSPGLIQPAQVVEYRDSRTPTNTWRGNVLGIQIACSQPGTGRVKQTVHIERHHYE